ncbi:hypothetical protein DPM19_07965 [Actinomadura craniellae]|uniref:Uncharacterized protein n=1 Tax=Actinomadura craniellae TaxID=2231787 RepID=A0A365H9L4_9ACTN|nr:DUF5947 family protein [Actinomadura craniellae]RAY15709.1 hypothetical protein DPM19_07965 [Actinomadura craniellae]
MTLTTPRLGRLSRRPPEPEPERCELCAEPLPDRHRHLLESRSRELRCACRACTVLFDRREAGGGSYRLVPDRCRYLPGLEIDDAWRALGVPVGLAFVFHDSAEDRPVARYPGPAGATAAAVPAAAWESIRAAHPVLREMAPDVEALLVNRVRDAREQWLAPIDDCYALAGLVRARRGPAGGGETWRAVEEFLADLRERSVTVED